MIISFLKEFESLRLRFSEISKGQTKGALLGNVFLKQGSLSFVRATRPSNRKITRGLSSRRERGVDLPSGRSLLFWGGGTGEKELGK